MLIDENLIRENALFIDGTKLEADANKYSFVWRRAVERYHDKLKTHALELYDELIKENVTQSIEREHAQEAAGLEEIAKNTDAKIEELNVEIDSGDLDKTEKSARKQLRRKLKKTPTNYTRTTFQESTNTSSQRRFSKAETAILKQTMKQSLCL